MAVRTSMVDLISRVRMLISDPAGEGQTFTDQEIQDVLDRYGTTVNYMELIPAETIAAGGSVSYLDYYADVGDWEADEKLYDASWNELAPSASDRLTGHWAFSESQTPPVTIVGKFYDVNAAAADLLEAWATKVALDFDFSTDGQSFRRSQKREALLELAAQYRKKARPTRAWLVRGDT